jgi:hypothetical protein
MTLIAEIPEFEKRKTMDSVQGHTFFQWTMSKVIHRSSYGYTPSPEAFRLNLKSNLLKYCVRCEVLPVVN